MLYFIGLTMVFLGMIFLQPLLPAIGGQHNWLLNFTPLILVYAAYRASDTGLAFFIVFTGMLHDFILSHYLGFGPLLWGVTIFLVRSQEELLEQGTWMTRIIMGFAAAFFYLCFDRVIFLLDRKAWIWDYELSFHIVLISIVNALMAPVVFWVLDRIYIYKPEVKEDFATRMRYHVDR